MASPRPRRICIAPSDIASYYAGLRTGFRELGIRCWFFCFDVSSYSRYRPEPDAFWLERWIFETASSAGLRRSTAMRLVRRAALRVLRLVALVWAVAHCDVFIFAGGRTLFWGLELPILRLLRRTVIFVFNGSDTRPPWMSGFFALGVGAPDPDKMLTDLRRQQRLVRKCECWATAIVCHPLSAHLLQRPFFNHLQIGHPCAPSAAPASARPPLASSAIRIVHAPTQPLQKGSARFRTIVDQLRREGRDIEYIELTGRPNHEVLEAIASCDLVLDETFSDIPLAGLGSEAAWAGRALVVGGYGAVEIAKFARGTGLPVEVLVHPNELDDIVRRLVDNSGLRAERARTAQQFLHVQWTPVAVAGRIMNIIDGTAPSTWRVDPTTLTYWQGWGAPEDAIRGAIRALVCRHGRASLGISHNPELEQRLCALSDSAVNTTDAATPAS